MKKRKDEITIKEIVKMFVPKIWLIMAVAALGAIILGLGSEFLKKDTYTSNVQLYSYIDKGINADLNDMTVAEEQVQIYEELFKSKKFRGYILTELTNLGKEQYAEYVFKATISVQQRSSSVFNVAVTTTDDEASFAIASAIESAALNKIMNEFIPNAGKINVFDNPTEPKTPNSKNVLRNSVIGFFGGALISMLAIFVYNLFDVTIRDRRKIEDHFDIPILSLIPRHEIENQESTRSIVTKKQLPHDSDTNDSMRIIDDKTPFAISEAFKSFYTNILYLPTQNKCKKIAITSGSAGEGKTYISINLALTIARSASEHKVLLIDSDMRMPRISGLINDVDGAAHGLSEYIAGIDETPNIQKTNLDNFSVLTSGSVSANATSLISSSRFANMIDEFSNFYDYIIFDTPPANIVSDAVLLSDHIDGYVIATRADYSNINDLSDVIDNINKVRGNIFGVCLTSISLSGGSKKKYGKNSHYSYYSK